MSISPIYRECTVKVNQGSGCLVQPESDEFTYVFTAKHVLYDRETNEELPPTITEYKTTIDISGYRVFKHPDTHIDAAIIRVKKIPDFKSPVLENKPIKKGDEFVLCGFPESRKDKSSGEGIGSLEMKATFDSADGKMISALTHNLANHSEVAGYSGGGIFHEHQGILFLHGIQSKMDDSIAQNGKVSFVHISAFLEIITENNLPGFRTKASTDKETARELIDIVKERITEHLEQENFSLFLNYLSKEYLESKSNEQSVIAKEIAEIITLDKTLNSPSLLLKCFYRYIEIKRNFDELTDIKNTLKSIVSWKLLTMLDKDFYATYTIEDKNVGINIDLNFSKEFDIDNFFVELSISGLYKKKPELGNPDKLSDSESGILKNTVKAKNVIDILEPGPAKKNFINCVLFSLYKKYNEKDKEFITY
ncbi:MAG: trypsin-like peptidase domain-containing protein, partial [Spirochaetales bacterium]|nr:trypsin-like peptidase domain-containing protein [Spirochaetales bacterium]